MDDHGVTFQMISTTAHRRRVMIDGGGGILNDGLVDGGLSFLFMPNVVEASSR